MRSRTGQRHVGTFLAVLVVDSAGNGMGEGVVEHHAEVTQEAARQEIELALERHLETEHIHAAAVHRAQVFPHFALTYRVGEAGEIGSELFGRIVYVQIVEDEIVEPLVEQAAGHDADRFAVIFAEQVEVVRIGGFQVRIAGRNFAFLALDIHIGHQRIVVRTGKSRGEGGTQHGAVVQVVFERQARQDVGIVVPVVPLVGVVIILVENVVPR